MAAAMASMMMMMNQSVSQSVSHKSKLVCTYIVYLVGGCVLFAWEPGGT